MAFLEYAFLNKGKEHPSGGSQLFSATIKRFVFKQIRLLSCYYIIVIYILNKRMLVEEPRDRIKTQNLHDDLEVKVIHCINVLKTII